MPASGVYPWTSPLWEALVAECRIITNRNILAEQLIQPFMEIKADHNAGINPYICRERYRQWCEEVHERIGDVQLPEWDRVIREDDWPYEIFDRLDEGGKYEWEIFVDESVNVFEIVHDLPLEAEADDFVRRLIERAPPQTLIVLDAPEFGCIYVIQSDTVENCGQVAWKSNLGVHVMDDIADGFEPGDIPTFVLPESIIESYEENLADEEVGQLVEEILDVSGHLSDY